MDEGPRQPAGDENGANHAAFETELAERFRKRLIVFATRRLGSPQQAEDVAQEVLGRVVQALRGQRLRDSQALGGFVFQTARHVCQQHARKSGRERRALDAAGGVADPPGEDPLVALVDRERRRAVRRALDRLGAEDRELLRGLYWDGRSYEELAGPAGATPEALRVRKHRALRRLERLLAIRPAETNPADREPGK